MNAIFQYNGQQYFVSEDKWIYMQKIPLDEGKEIIFDKIIMMNGVFGKPFISNAKVIGIVEKHSKQKKVIVFKYKPKKNYKRKYGHRQDYTRVKILKIIDDNK